MINKIIRKYETDYDRDVEIEIGERFKQIYCSSETELVNMPYLSTYDFKVIKRGKQTAWLEVKRKEGDWWDTEIIPITKWRFAKESNLPCYMLIERCGKAVLFNITNIIERNLGRETEIKRREDQPEGSKKVVRFSTTTGQTIYYI